MPVAKVMVTQTAAYILATTVISTPCDPRLARTQVGSYEGLRTSALNCERYCEEDRPRCREEDAKKIKGPAIISRLNQPQKEKRFIYGTHIIRVAYRL